MRVSRLGALVVAAVLLVNSSPLVEAQLGIETQNASGDSCECSPACEGDVGGALGGGGCRGRVVVREDCPCCKVCSQQKGTKCSHPSRPCDTQFGLICSVEGICEAEYSCQTDSECPDDRFCLGEVCVDPCPILTPCQGALKGGECVSTGHRPGCQCPEGTIANSAGDVCVSNNGTTEGCEHDGRLYAKGETRYTGKCQEQCQCGADGQFSCGPVSCPAGLFLAGQHSKEELCIELRNRPETDECCVVVVCANSLTRPSLLSSPADMPPSDPITEEEATSAGQTIRALSGRNVGLERIEPITEEEYQKRLKDLELELNKGLSEKKKIYAKQGTSPQGMNATGNTEETAGTENQEMVTEEAPAAITEMTMVDKSMQDNGDMEEITTMMPEMQQDDQMMVMEGDEPAVVVEYNDDGEEVHRITVQEQVEVVTSPSGELEMTTVATGLAEEDMMPTDAVPEGEEEMSTEAAPVEVDEGDGATREGKMTQEEEATANESAITFQEKVESKLPAGGLKVLAISHNSSTLVLPSTKGGDIYYKAFKGSQDWQRVSVEAGQDSLVLKGLQPNTQYTLKWSGESGGSAKITIDTQEGCKHKNVSYGVSQEWSDGCQHRCSCRPGGIPNCQPRCLFVAGDIKDPLCTERPSPEDPECCVVYDCKKTDEITVSTILNEEQAPGQPKLLVTEKTHNSVTIAWDDFRPRTYEGGYVVEYREGDEPSAAVPNEEAWMMKELPTGPHQPKLTVENLKPSTVYQVRVSIYDDTDHTGLGESTETLTVRTEPGCMYNNESYMVGESFIGCEERCVCYVNGDIKCFERCSLPYFRAGSFKDDPLCRELPKEGDDCCVIVQCATSNASVRQGINATSFTEVSYNQCTNVVCGANAECVSRPVAADNLNPGDGEVTLGYCRCLKGFVGDAADLRFGCVASPSPDQMEGGCTYKNSTYRSGETFYDGCDYRCSCNDNSEIECEPRCEFPHANGTKTEPGCEYIPDPEDTCCKLRVCNSTSEAATDAARAPSLISDGCTEGNVTYAKNEKFYKGCQTQCTCIGFGDVECVPRCPPLKVMSDTPKRCETLPDPLDACCLITVCDQETPDVMKANITEMEKEMMMMKERMKNMTQMEKDMLMKRMSELEKEMMMKNISAMEMTLQKMIEEQDKLMMNTNISEMEKEMIRSNMTEIEMMMRAVAEMEKEITTTNMTDIDRAILKLKLMEMQNKLTEEMSTDENGVTDEHALSHVLGLEHSHAQHMDDMKNHTHTHENGITHTHPGGHLPHSHDDMENITHTHEDGTTHTHPAGHIPHTHDDMNDMDAAHSHTHAHDDNETHSHPHDHMDDSHNHTHDLNVEHGHEHTHEDGTTHMHPHEHMDESHNHTHDDMDENHNNTHMHEDGTIHSHPHEHVDESHNHTHEMDDHTHTHEDGTTHNHPHEHMDDSHNHTHEMGENHTHTHEDGMTHEHMDDSLNHTHEMDDHTHTHEDGTTHSHPHEHMDESHNHTHDMDEILNTHMHEDGTVHSHPHENMDDHNHEHTHEDGTTHSHPHEHMDDSHNHTHEMDDSHDHVHIHADGTTHSHPHEHMNDSHVHEHDMQEGKNDTHVHENGMIHSHPVVDEFHNHTLFNTLEKKNRAEDLGTHDLNILDVMPVNTTAVKVTVGVSENVMSQILSSEDQYVKVFYSPDSLTWMEKNVSVRDIQVMNMEEIVFFINDLQPSTSYQFRISYHDFVSTTSKARLLGGTVDTDGMDMGIDIDTSVMCSREGRYYKPGEEFYQGCSHSCICSSSLEIHCAAIECPVTFGLELIDPNCIEWDVDTDYVPTPPKCCPQVKCIESAACHYMGQIFNNYDTIPRELTGCSKVCTCNYGNVTCRDLCDPIPSTPPPDLNCAPEDAVRITLPGETCCETWQCSAHSVGGTPVVFPLPPDSVLGGNPTSGFIPITPNFNEVDGIAKPHITSVDPNTARLSFSIPAHYQGLPGELLVRYTKMPIAQPDPMTWTQDVLVQSGNTINHSKWDYSIGNLDPATQYTMQLVLTVLGANSITSPVFSYTTMDEAITSPPTTTPLPRLEIDAELYASEITKTSAKVSWRHFDDYELQYIDGVQVKYTEKDKLIPKFSQLFHRDNNQMDLRGLQPGNNYTVDLVFMTHKNQTTQVSNTDPITFTTLPEEDPYAFDITVVAGKVSSQSAELTYSGVPEPEEKYVNVYRAVYLREVERIDAQSFKIPKIGQEKKIFLNDLKPDVEYQVWLEAYLSNGRNKKSNVITIKTRAGQLPTPERSEVDPSVPTDKEGDGYYPALVAVAIIAAIACIGFLGLLIILLRKQNHAKAHINSSRNNAAYDNPSYKVGDNGYDMEMNGIKGSGNGATHMEEP